MKFKWHWVRFCHYGLGLNEKYVILHRIVCIQPSVNPAFLLSTNPRCLALRHESVRCHVLWSRRRVRQLGAHVDVMIFYRVGQEIWDICSQ
jgi:hypothetical protein